RAAPTTTRVKGSGRSSREPTPCAASRLGSAATPARTASAGMSADVDDEEPQLRVVGLDLVAARRLARERDRQRRTGHELLLDVETVDVQHRVVVTGHRESDGPPAPP